jgi:NodT family efflux transporter outer membrane factor (OMF) lipoprotein
MNFDWWKNYNDDILMSHLETVYSNNHNLKIAAYKTKQAEENVRLVGAKQLPQVGIDAELTRTMRGAQTEFGSVIIPKYSQNNFLLPLSASYEIDIWGENYLSRKSAKKQKEVAIQEERSTYIYLTSTFAANYFNLIKADKMEKITRDIIDIQSKVVSMVEKKYNLGLASINELLSEKQLLVQQEETLNRIVENKKVINNELITLLGQKTDAEVEHSSFEKIVYPATPDSLAATIVQYRPDLIESEKYAQKAGIDVSIAKREFLPKFILWGNVGFNAYRWNSIFNNTTFLSNIGVAPEWNIFTGGYKMARYRINKYEYKKAGEMYEQALLTSIQELNDAMIQTKTTKANLKKSEEDYSLENQKYILAEKQYEIGDSSKLDEMKANLNLLITEQRHVSSVINDVISTISLYNAVGGVDYTQEKYTNL